MFRTPSTGSSESTPTPPCSPTPPEPSVLYTPWLARHPPALPRALLVPPSPLRPPTPTPIAQSVSPSPTTQLFHSFLTLTYMSDGHASPVPSEPMEPEQAFIPAWRSFQTSKITLATMPPHFDGVGKSKWDTWHETLKNYMWAYSKEFATPKAKIAFTISLLGSKDGTPTPARVLDEDNEELPEGYSFKKFLDDLSRTFKDQNKSALANFIQAFELNAEEAGYHLYSEHGEHNQFLCENLENLVNPEVHSQLYAGGIEIPEDYLMMKKRMMTIGRILEPEKLRNAQLKHNTGTPFWVPAKIPVTPTGNTR
ncbi:hypothetical protein B0H17DRAFT_1193777 [Mycena rosella]|uniref:Uncharacterized protein n=1 Tax=Mycena rosella TaxID=1033263 RepID=A0AAD7GT45_MYCRO|nr:hypothetical protein B0H17DRAFT_1193777 [Mycena rosella]